MATIRYIKDKDEVVILPVTHEKSVIDSNGVTLETKLRNLQPEITVDPTPTSGSSNPVSSGGVYSALENNNGIVSVTSQQDGTISISLTSGDTIVIDLNHDHSQYLKYVYLESYSEMPVNPDENTLYLIKDDSNA